MGARRRRPAAVPPEPIYDAQRAAISGLQFERRALLRARYAVSTLDPVQVQLGAARAAVAMDRIARYKAALNDEGEIGAQPPPGA